MEREVGGGIRMGMTCKLKDVSFQCMTKFTTNLKKKIKKTNKQKKRTQPIKTILYRPFSVFPSVFSNIRMKTFIGFGFYQK